MARSGLGSAATAKLGFYHIGSVFEQQNLLGWTMKLL